jgi:hypothetical protein
MTCVWDALLASLRPSDFIVAGMTKPRDAAGLVAALMGRNTHCDDVVVNGSFLSAKQKEELFEWVKSYDVGGISNGHLTGTCDPFLALVCQLLCLTLRHFSSGSVGTFRFDTVTVYSHRAARRVVEFDSNAGHFSARP